MPDQLATILSALAGKPRQPTTKAAAVRAIAKMQLAEIEKRCGTTCEEYGDLSKAIAAATN